MRRSLTALTASALLAALFTATPSTVSSASDPDSLFSTVTRESAHIGVGDVISYRTSVRWTEKVCRGVRAGTKTVNVCRTVTFTSPAPVKVRFCTPYRSRGVTTEVCRDYQITPTRVPPAPVEPTPSPLPTIIPTPTPSPLPTSPETTVPGPVLEAPSSSYAFAMTDRNNKPVRFEACRTLNWSVEGTEAEKALTRAAITELSAVSGMQFREIAYDGYRPLLDVLPSDMNSSAQLVLRWYDAGSVPDLAGDVAGVTETRSWSTADRTRSWMSFAAVAIERDNSMNLRPTAGNHVWPVLLHELGHAVGLAHVTDRAQLMFPSTWTGTADSYQNGDRAGLARVGRINDRCN